MNDGDKSKALGLRQAAEILTGECDSFGGDVFEWLSGQLTDEKGPLDVAADLRERFGDAVDWGLRTVAGRPDGGWTIIIEECLARQLAGWAARHGMGAVESSHWRRWRVKLLRRIPTWDSLEETDRVFEPGYRPVACELSISPNINGRLRGGDPPCRGWRDVAFCANDAKEAMGDAFRHIVDSQYLRVEGTGGEGVVTHPARVRPPADLRSEPPPRPAKDRDGRPVGGRPLAGCSFDVDHPDDLKEIAERSDADAMRDALATKFGLRRVDFGTPVLPWVRASRLAQLNVALGELARSMDVPNGSLGLDGGLSLSIGGGDPFARYDRETMSLRLPLWPQAGSLAHDWFLAWHHTVEKEAPLVGEHAFHFDYSAIDEDEDEARSFVAALAGEYSYIDPRQDPPERIGALMFEQVTTRRLSKLFGHGGVYRSPQLSLVGEVARVDWRLLDRCERSVRDIMADWIERAKGKRRHAAGERQADGMGR